MNGSFSDKHCAEKNESSHDTWQENNRLDRAIAEAEIEATTRDYRAKQPHRFDSTGADESNEPLICALCGLDVNNKIHTRGGRP